MQANRYLSTIYDGQYCHLISISPDCAYICIHTYISAWLLAVIHSIYRRETGYSNDAFVLINDTDIYKETDVYLLRDIVFVTNNQANFSFSICFCSKKAVIRSTFFLHPTTYPCSFCRLFPCYYHKRKRTP